MVEENYFLHFTFCTNDIRTIKVLLKCKSCPHLVGSSSLQKKLLTLRNNSDNLSSLLFQTYKLTLVKQKFKTSLVAYAGLKVTCKEGNCK